jgi:hypothetical protein
VALPELPPALELLPPPPELELPPADTEFRAGPLSELHAIAMRLVISPAAARLFRFEPTFMYGGSH